MPASALCIDYAPTSRDDGWQVTAAQRLDINVLRELAGRLRLRWRPSYRMPVRSAPFPRMTAADQGRRGGMKSTGCGRPVRPGAVTPALMSGPSQLAGQLQVPLRLCIDAGDEASRFDVWQVIHRRQPPLPADGDRYAIALGLALGAGGMTHVVNLLPWRDLRRRQRLRYVLLLTIGIVLLAGMACW